MTKSLATKYASAERSSPDTIARQKKIVDQYLGSFRQLYDAAVSETFLIVNRNRQIVFFSKNFQALVGTDDPERLYGMRPGEALDCANACKTPGGCGTSEFCSRCGGVKTMLSALNNQPDIQECWILRRDRLEAFELLVKTTPLTIGKEHFSIVAIADISHEKRRRALERTFFHDVMNTAESIRIFAGMLDSEETQKTAPVYRENLQAGIRQLIEQLHSHRVLFSAENNELEIRKQTFSGYELIREVADSLQAQFPEHSIRLFPSDTHVMLNTDRGLLRRVLENMMRNALEASMPEQEVSASCGIKDGRAEFRVHNPTPIPRKNQLQIFQRSFSTKGPGRGLGTYCMKLLSERFLDGSVGFTSSEENGTTFFACFPCNQNP